VPPLAIKLLSVRRSLPLFLAIVVGLAIWQVRLTWRLIQQDRDLAVQQSRERLEQIADLAVAQLGSTLGDWELSLRELDKLPPSPEMNNKLVQNGAFVLISRGSVITYPAKPLLFVPDLPSAPPLPDVFDGIEKLEFRDQNYPAAIEALRKLTKQAPASAEAWLRIARLERRLGHPRAALAAYDQLLVGKALTVDGAPYALLAAAARSELQPDDKVITQLHDALLAGQWPLRRETFEYYWAKVAQLRNSSDAPPKASLNFASLVARLYEESQKAIRNGANSNGREFEPDESILLWSATPARLTALYAPPNWLGSSLKLPANARDIRWKWIPPGAKASEGANVLRSLADAELNGKLEFRSVAPAVSRRLNRSLWLAGVVLMLLLMLAGAYAMYRGVSRELEVAKLQTDFVAAVSHEFRSPLTTLRMITELLSQDRITEESRRRQSYAFLDRETIRLNRLVEDLLDFGRMESGRRQYQMESHDAFELVRHVIASFSEEAQASGFHVQTSLDTEPANIVADQEAFCRALRNLLENAMKYSPECRTVWVEGRLNQKRVAISVRDQGMGIDPKEQRDVFQKFVRGAAAKKAGIKGTGIGLSMVRQIISACGGELRLESTLGRGSTFTISLPLVGERRSRA
jgi:signal transduction histidine kinase/cytochrome c-type biogenesis protein CcmH/NrfG